MLHTLALVEQGYLAEANGDLTAAWTAHNQALELALRTGSPPTAAPALEGLACALALTGDPRQASRLLGSALAARDPHSDSPNTPKTGSHPDLRRAFEALQPLLTPEELATGLKEGHRAAAEGRIPRNLKAHH
ncbi:hypothetical protein [Nesterenkonia ebinurensis]|uniref:hypothetical protein n=1 Tax=Nesterenkonia ebinurensis TaxID=2608252 RepID=UPI00123C9802|nr:hypothetical protein [Nesterenkonia ebinurensis]